MKQYLYIDTKEKDYIILSLPTKWIPSWYNLIGKVSEVVAAYQNRGKSQYNNATKE